MSVVWIATVGIVRVCLDEHWKFSDAVGLGSQSYETGSALERSAHIQNPIWKLSTETDAQFGLQQMRTIRQMQSGSFHST